MEVAAQAEVDVSGRLRVSLRDGDAVRFSLRCAGMSQHQAEEAVVAAHALRHDRVRGRHRVLFPHHGR